MPVTIDKLLAKPLMHQHKDSDISDWTTANTRYVNLTGDTMTGDLQTVDLKLSGGDIYPTTDSTTAIQINKADGTTNVFNVDTTNGRVGIGTTAPGRLLEVSGNSANDRIRINSADTTAAQYSGFEIFGSGAFKGGIFVQNSAKDVVQIWDNSSAVINLKSGNVGIGTTGPTEKLDINSDAIRIRTAQTPASGTATGDVGTIAWDSSYLYIWTATNVVKRVALSAF